MSGFEAEAPGSLLPELSGDVSTSDDDKALMDVWTRNNDPVAALDKPPMPASFAAAEGDDVDSHVRASYHWNELPLGERQLAYAVDFKNADLKRQAQALGMKCESASDFAAIQKMISGGQDQPQQQQQPIDRDTQASLDVYRSIVPGAKDHREASQYLSGWVEHIARDPETGWRQLLEAQGMGHLLHGGQQQYAAQPQQYAQHDEAAAIEGWIGEKGLSQEDRHAMAEIIQGPTWRTIAGESDRSTLDRAYKALQRSQARNGNSRMNADLDRTLRGIAHRR